MSYYGVRKTKTIQNENGKYNLACEYYDSSIRSWEGNRVWHTCPEGLYKEGFNTKEELEYAVFKDTLDGNLHGTGGKFSCIGWNKCKVKLTEEELNKIKELEDKKYSLMFSEEVKKLERELRDNGVEYKDMEDVSPRYKELRNEIKKACNEYEEYRYTTWFNAWKKYLEEKKEQDRKGSKRTYIVMVDYIGYTNIFVRGHGSRTTKFTNWEDMAKLFTNSVEELKDMFCDEYRGSKYSKVSLIDVTNSIVGKGKNKHAVIKLHGVDKKDIIRLK